MRKSADVAYRRRHTIITVFGLPLICASRRWHGHLVPLWRFHRSYLHFVILMTVVVNEEPIEKNIAGCTIERVIEIDFHIAHFFSEIIGVY